MPSHVIRRFFGLCSSVNPYGTVPEGALSIADECVVRSKDLLEPRRGYEILGDTVPRQDQLVWANGSLISLEYLPGAGILFVHSGSSGAYVSIGENGAAPLFMLPPAGATRMPAFTANKSLFLQSRYGLLRADVGSGILTPTLRHAYQPPNWTQGGTSGALGRGSQAYTAAAITGVGAWLATGYKVAYRITLCRIGAAGELIEGPPSDRIIYSNTSGSTVGPALALEYFPMVPARVSAGTPGSGASYNVKCDSFLRVYRSKAVVTAADPADEMFLVAEHSITPTVEDTFGYVSLPTGANFIDRTADSALYVPLYTNPWSGEGITQANAGAPVAQDAFWFKDRAHYLNTAGPHSMVIKLIGTSTGGVSAGDWIDVDGFRFTFVATSTALGQVVVYTGGTVAANLENTALDLVKQINYRASVSTAQYSGRVAAYYLAGSSTDAGQILITRLVPGGESFAVRTSSASGWGADYTLSVSSTNDAQLAGWAWSKVGQPEAVPPDNYSTLGDAAAPALRGIALRDSAFVLKTDGVWRVVDDGVGPSAQLFDPTAKCVAPWTAAALKDSVIALYQQGVLLIDEMGVQNISENRIERDLLKLMAYVGPTTLSNLAFAIARESEHEYILCLPESPTATSCTLQYVFNLQTHAWTRWRLPGVISGAVDTDGRLYWSLGPSQGISSYLNTIWRERRQLDFTDLQDPSSTIACPASTAVAAMTFAGDQRPLIAVGDLVQQAQATYFLRQRVTTVTYSSSGNTTTITLDAAPDTAWSTGQSLTIIKAIQVRPRWTPFHVDQPAVSKDVAFALALFRYFDLDAFSVTWASDLYDDDTGVEATPIEDGEWAPDTWGDGFWGKQTKDVLVKLSIPGELSSASLLTLELLLPCALTRFELGAIDLSLTASTEKAVR